MSMNWYKIAQTEQDLQDGSNLQSFLDSFGTPFYHGTDYKFNEFSLNTFGRTDQGFAGKGLYFTTNKGYAKEYGSNIREVYLDLQNPYIINDSPSINPDYVKRELGLPITATASDVTEKLQSMGHDGVVVNYEFDDEFDGTSEGFETMVFSPSQVITKEQVVNDWKQSNPPQGEQGELV